MAALLRQPAKLSPLPERRSQAGWPACWSVAGVGTGAEARTMPSPAEGPEEDCHGDRGLGRGGRCIDPACWRSGRLGLRDGIRLCSIQASGEIRTGALEPRNKRQALTETAPPPDRRVGEAVAYVQVSPPGAAKGLRARLVAG
jgi:hypothetical protein